MNPPRYGVRAHRSAANASGLPAATGWTRANGVVLTFDTPAEAQTRADALNRTVAHHPLRALHYAAAPYDGDEEDPAAPQDR